MLLNKKLPYMVKQLSNYGIIDLLKFIIDEDIISFLKLFFVEKDRNREIAWKEAKSN